MFYIANGVVVAGGDYLYIYNGLVFFGVDPAGSGYQIEYGLSGGNTVIQDVGTNLTYTQLNLTPGVAYTARVRSYSGMEFSAWTDWVEVYTSSTLLIGSVVWGHSTSVVEDNTKVFTGNWTGTALIAGSGDAENIAFDSAEYEESETWEIGSGRVRLTIDKYGTGSGSPIVKYKQGSSSVNCEADTWHAYTPFLCSGWIKVRIEAA